MYMFSILNENGHIYLDKVLFSHICDWLKSMCGLSSDQNSYWLYNSVLFCYSLPTLIWITAKQRTRRYFLVLELFRPWVENLLRFWHNWMYMFLCIFITVVPWGRCIKMFYPFPTKIYIYFDSPHPTKNVCNHLLSHNNKYNYLYPPTITILATRFPHKNFIWAPASIIRTLNVKHTGTR